jgi:uncharacterized membrane protein HdeD (DUF308 family)
MRIYTSGLGTRLAGSALGLGFAVIGAFAVVLRENAPDAAVQNRSLWLGITFLVAGIAAFSVSWLVSDLSNVWCRPPSRSLWRRK